MIFYNFAANFIFTSFMHFRQTLIFISIIIFILTIGCKKKSVQISQSSGIKEKLSEYGFFEGKLSDLKPKTDVLPYDLNTPLFTDYAYKTRFIWMPKDSSAKYNPDHVLEFPKGTVLIKNFYYHHDERKPEVGRRIIETRLLSNNEKGWEVLTYIWNKEQTEAFFDKAGDILPVSWVNSNGKDMSIQYIIPNKNQCKSCHTYKGNFTPIGPKVAHLNRDFVYADGPQNQLAKWQSMGYLTGYDPNQEHPKAANMEDKSKSIHDRAMAYLDINCAHCHNPHGAANTSGLTLTHDSPKDLNLGIYKATVSAGAGTGGNTYSIVPGKPEESILVYRMQSTNPGAMMPELGRTLVHDEGVALISDWIKSMNPKEFDHIEKGLLK